MRIGLSFYDDAQQYSLPIQINSAWYSDIWHRTSESALFLDSGTHADHFVVVIDI